MAFEITWSPRALKTFTENIEYLLANWTEKEVAEFGRQTDSILDTISKFPESFPSGRKKRIRKVVITQQVTLYYRVKKKEVQLIVFWQSRMNPRRLTL